MNEALVELLKWVLGLSLIVGLLLALRRPLGKILRLLLRTGVGLAALALFSQAGAYIGVTLGVNLVNAFVLGVLGLPGLGLLLMVRWISL